MFALGFEPLHSVAVSLSVGCLVSSLLCVVFFLSCGGKPAKPDSDAPAVLRSNAPLTLSRVINALFSSFTAFAVTYLFVVSGYSQSRANALLGASMGMALPLLFIPGTLVSSLAFVLIPHLGSMNVNTEKERVNKTVSGAITFAVIVSCAFIGFYSACAIPLCELVYGNEESGIFLRTVSWALLPMSVESITSSMMNSLDLEIRGFVNGILGYSMLWLVAIIFWGKFTINVLGLGFALSWCLSAALQIASIRKKTGLKFEFLLPSIKAVLICFPAATLASNVYDSCALVSPFVGLIASFGLQAAFFLVACLVFGAVSISSVRAVRRKKLKTA
jgi:stage V sporulation protein B